MLLQSLTPSEEEVMRLIWKNGKMYFRELMASFPEPKPHQNTVSTFLKILVDKNYLNIEKHGRIYLYSSTVNFDEYKKFLLKRFLENYFYDSGIQLLKLLFDEKFIRPKDFNQFFELKTSVVPLQENLDKDTSVKDFIKELTTKKAKKKEKKKAKKKKNR